MLLVFLSIFAADTKLICGYNFVNSLNSNVQLKDNYMLKGFQTKENSKYERTLHFNQIYEKSTSSFVGLIPVFNDGFFHLIFKLSKKQSSAQFSVLSIILILSVTVVLICPNIF